jgi:hypothetical protein
MEYNYTIYKTEIGENGEYSPDVSKDKVHGRYHESLRNIAAMTAILNSASENEHYYFVNDIHDIRKRGI